MNKIYFRLGSLLVLTLLWANTLLAQTPYTSAKKKIIEFGWDIPNYDYVADNIVAMEYAPFDGVVFDMRIPKLNGTVRRAWSVCNPDEVKETDFDFTKLSKIKSSKLSDNFIRVFMQDDYDQVKFGWFDETVWSNIKKTTRLLSKAVKLSNSQGVFLDTEEYGGVINPWEYTTTIYPNYTEKQVYDKVRQRGREYMTELQTEVPNMKLMYTFAYDFIENWGNGSYYAQKYALLKPFLDGMLEAAGPQITLIDGNEATYFTDKNEDHTWWYDQIENQYLKDRIPSELITKYKKQYRTGYASVVNRYFDIPYGQAGYDFDFGFSIDSQRKWTEHSIYNRLLNTDEYVWTWSQGDVDWWKKATFKGKDDYANAIIAAKAKLNAGQRLGYTMGYAGNELKADVSISPVVATMTFPAHNSIVPVGEITFKVQYNDPAKNNYQYFYINSISKGYTLSDTAKITLPAGIYTAYVFGYDKDNKSYQSNPVTFTVGTPTVADTQAPTAPSNILANNITSNSFGLTWTASTDNVGVKEYEILINNVSFGKSATPNFTVTNRTASTSYGITIRAIDAAGNVSLVSPVLSVTTKAATDTQAPSAPSNVLANNITSNSFGLTWAASTDNVGVKEYEVFINNISFGKSATPNFTVTNRTASTTYAITVKAIDAAGNVSLVSPVLSVTTKAVADTQAPSAPSNVLANNITNNSFGLTWTASTDNVGVKEYEILINNVSFGKSATTSFLVTNRTASTSYGITIRAIDAAGNVSLVSPVLSVTTKANTITSGKIIDFVNQPAGFIPLSPSKYSNVDDKNTDAYFTNFNTYDGVVSDQIFLDNSSTGNNRMAQITNNYAIFSFTQKVKIPSFYVSTLVSGANTGWKIEGTLNGITQFTFVYNNTFPNAKWGEVTAGAGKEVDKLIFTNAKDCGIDDIKIENSVVILDTQAPTTPKNLYANNVTKNSFLLSWAASSDNIGVTKYDIYQDLKLIATVSGTTFFRTINGLTPNTSYSMTVKAIDAVGNVSNPTLPLLVKTLPDVIYNALITFTEQEIGTKALSPSIYNNIDNKGSVAYFSGFMSTDGTISNPIFEDKTPNSVNRIGLVSSNYSAIYFSKPVAVSSFWVNTLVLGKNIDWKVEGMLNGIPQFTFTYNNTFPNTKWGEVTAGVGKSIDRLIFTNAKDCGIDDVKIEDAPTTQLRITNGQNAKVAPNPILGTASVSFSNNAASQATIILSDLNGKVCLTKTIDTTVGENYFALEVENITSGIYLLQILRAERNETIRVIIQR